MPPRVTKTTLGKLFPGWAPDAPPTIDDEGNVRDTRREWTTTFEEVVGNLPNSTGPPAVDGPTHAYIRERQPDGTTKERIIPATEYLAELEAAEAADPLRRAVALRQIIDRANYAKRDVGIARRRIGEAKAEVKRREQVLRDTRARAAECEREAQEAEAALAALEAERNGTKKSPLEPSEGISDA